MLIVVMTLGEMLFDSRMSVGSALSSSSFSARFLMFRSFRSRSQSALRSKLLSSEATFSQAFSRIAGKRGAHGRR